MTFLWRKEEGNDQGHDDQRLWPTHQTGWEWRGAWLVYVRPGVSLSSDVLITAWHVSGDDWDAESGRGDWAASPNPLHVCVHKANQYLARHGIVSNANDETRNAMHVLKERIQVSDDMVDVLLDEDEATQEQEAEKEYQAATDYLDI